MNILFVNGGNLASFDRPYVNKFSMFNTIENSIYICDCDTVEITGSETEALALLAKKRYDSLIISTGGDVNGFMLLEKIRNQDEGSLPVTII